jgi:hypothetical protein
MDKSEIFLSHKRMFANPNCFWGNILAESMDLRTSEKVGRRGELFYISLSLSGLLHTRLS